MMIKKTEVRRDNYGDYSIDVSFAGVTSEDITAFASGSWVLSTGEAKKVEKVFDLPDLKIPRIERIIFSPPATVILWEDNTKTVVKCMEGDEFSEEEGFLAAVGKKLFGSHTAYKSLVFKTEEELLKAVGKRLFGSRRMYKSIIAAAEHPQKESEENPTEPE